MKQNNKDFEFEDKVPTSQERIPRLQKKNWRILQDFLEKEWGQSASWRSFTNNFYSTNPLKAPHAKAFTRVIERLKDHCSAHSRKSTGNEPLSMDTVENVKNFFTENDRSHIQELSNLNVGMVWKDLRKDLNWEAFSRIKRKSFLPPTS